MKTKQAKQIEDDRALIAALGGPARLAEKLNFDKYGGVQRVQNWITRGIPATVKLDRPDLFLAGLKTPAANDAAQAAEQGAANA